MLLEGRKAGAILADKAYGSKEILLQIAKNKSEAVIPSKKNAKKPRYYDKDLYKERQVVECFFQKIKEFRRIATRYDKLQVSYRAFTLLASCLIWLR